MKKYYTFFISFLLILNSCSEDSVGPEPPGTVSSGVYIINEGLFGQNNSSLSYYNTETGDLINDAYRSANGGNSLGDNANSMFIKNGKGYIAVNGSNKIEIVDLETFVSSGFIDLGQNGSPREVWVKDSVSGYTTSLSGQVIKFNPDSKTVLKFISVGSFPEGLAEASGKLFVANSWFGDTTNISNTVSVIDLSIDLEALRIRVGVNPTKIINGPDGNIYVICTGSYTNANIFSGVYIIDPNTNVLLDSIRVSDNPFEGCFVSGSRLLVVNSEGVMDVDLSTKTVAQTPLITTSAVNSFQFGSIYSIAFDESQQIILCGNPKDFQQNGEIVIFDLTGTETGRVNVGINPGTIVINNN